MVKSNFMSIQTVHPSKGLFLLLAFIFVSYFAKGQGVLDGYFSPNKETDIILSYTSKSFNSFYQGTKEQSPVPIHESLNENIANLYISYAASEKMTIVASIPYVSVSSGTNTADPVQGTSKISGLQDIGLYAKLRALKKETSQGTLLLGGAVGGSMPGSDYNPGGLLSLGNGATAIDVLGLARFDFKGGVFADIQLGISNRLGEVPNALLFSGKFGYAAQNFYATAYLNQQNSLSGGDITGISLEELNNLPKTRVNYLILGLNGYFLLTNRWGITINTGVLANGRNIGQFSFLTFGVGYKLR